MYSLNANHQPYGASADGPLRDTPLVCVASRPPYLSLSFVLLCACGDEVTVTSCSSPLCVMVFQYNPTLSVGLSLNSNDTLSFLSTNRAESAPLVQSSKLLLVLYILI